MSTTKNVMFVWSDIWPDYETRMKWMNASFNVVLALRSADQLSLVEV
jgi:hypothetical protein